MNIYSIYKATNIANGKCYVGFDSNWPKRQKNHYKESYNIKRKTYWFNFHKAIRQYGWKSFKWDVCFQSVDGSYTLNIMEPFFIACFNSYYLWENGGYNMTLGGGGSFGYITSLETKIKQKLAKENIYVGEKNPFYGKTHTLFVRNKISNVHSLQWNVISPVGEHMIITNLNKLCKDNNLNNGRMYQIAQNKPGCKSHKGWKCWKI